MNFNESCIQSQVVPGLQKKVEELRAEYEASNPEVPSSPASDAEECNGDTNGNPPRRARSVKI